MKLWIRDESGHNVYWEWPKQRMPRLVLRVQSDGRGVSRPTKGKNGETRPASMKTDAESQGWLRSVGRDSCLVLLSGYDDIYFLIYIVTVLRWSLWGESWPIKTEPAWFLVNDQLDLQFVSLYLFQFSTCFEQPRAHIDNQLYQYNLWYMCHSVSVTVSCAGR
jgi:hypothetical protein